MGLRKDVEMPARSELETVIVWTADTKRATVYSLMPRVWRRCERAGGELIRTTHRDGRVASKEYLLPVESIIIRHRRGLTLSAEERARRVEHMRRLRECWRRSEIDPVGRSETDPLRA